MNDKRPTSGHKSGSPQDWYRMTGAGFEFIVAILIFGGIGWYVDTRADTSPWWTLFGVGVGFAVGLYLLIRLARRMFRD